VDDNKQDRTVVLAVVLILGLLALVGLSGTIWLAHDKVDATLIAVVSTPTGAVIGALAALLATTSSGPAPQVQQAQAAGYQQAVEDVKALAPQA
jgi:hypothetical protein